MLGCANDPGGVVAFVGGSKSGVSSSCPWGTVVVATGTVSGSNPCEPGFGEIIILVFFTQSGWMF